MSAKYDWKSDLMKVAFVLLATIYLFCTGLLVVGMCLGKVDCTTVGKTMICHSTESSENK